MRKGLYTETSSLRMHSKTQKATGNLGSFVWPPCWRAGLLSDKAWVRSATAYIWPLRSRIPAVAICILWEWSWYNFLLSSRAGQRDWGFWERFGNQRGSRRGLRFSSRCSLRLPGGWRGVTLILGHQQVSCWGQTCLHGGLWTVNELGIWEFKSL